MFSLPNLLTLSNLLSGSIAVLFACNGDLRTAAYFVILSGIFDFFDGFVARKLNIDSPLGAQLDSLADMVTFGLVPAIFLYQLLSQHFASDSFLKIGALPGFLFAIGACLRLAKFNISTDQTSYFKGLATPAATLFVIGLPFWYESNLYLILCDKIVLYIFCIGAMLLMISNYKMLAFKFKDYSWAGNKSTYIFVIACALAMLILGLKALPFIIIAYILYSFFYFRHSID